MVVVWERGAFETEASQDGGGGGGGDEFEDVNWNKSVFIVSKG